MSLLTDVPDHVPVFVVLALILALFVWDRFRYEAVALGALVVLVVLGAIDPGDAFSGLGHPAVVTVAAVLVISQALVNAGVVDTIARPLTAVKGGVMVQVHRHRRPAVGVHEQRGGAGPADAGGHQALQGPAGAAV